jgi:hypothetical protein
MERERNSDLQMQNGAMASLPPAVIDEAGWDILLALCAGERRGQSVEKLGPMVSLSRMTLGRWLSDLEDRRLIIAARDEVTGELLAVLTREGRELLDGYFSAISVFHAGSQH